MKLLGGNGVLHIVRKEGYHDPQNRGTWGSVRNMGMDTYTAGGDTQNGPETLSPWLTPGAQLPSLTTTTTSGDTVDPSEPRIRPSV
jgi:hypothetical protein